MPAKVPAVCRPLTVRRSPGRAPTSIVICPAVRLKLSTSVAVAAGEIVVGASFSV